MTKQLLGWREWVGLPELGIERIKAKVDTGARTSALHAFSVAPSQQAGELWVDFSVHPLQRRDDTVVNCSAKVLDQRVVRDSGGHEEERFVIETQVLVGDECLTIEMTLTSRDNMGFRMLLGRTALEDRYVVDASASYLQGKRK